MIVFEKETKIINSIQNQTKKMKYITKSKRKKTKQDLKLKSHYEASRKN